MASRVYMDYNASAPLLKEAKEAMLEAMDLLGNPSSVHKEGQAARQIVNRARDRVAEICDAQPAHITFTSGATEAACHLLTPHYKMGRSDLHISKLYMAAVEHPCVLSGGRFATDDVVRIEVNSDALIDLAELEAALSQHDQAQGLPMLALQIANNETGVVQPVKEAISIARTHKALIVLDAVQVIGRLPFSIEEFEADFAFFSAHKIGGPKGVGAIVSRGEVLMPAPLIVGGGHEKGHRGGTENLIGIAGFGASCDMAAKRLADYSHLLSMRDQIIDEMRKIAPDLVIHGENVERIGNTICFSLPGLKSETLQIAFDMEQVAVSSGSACSSGKVGESHVLQAMGADAKSGAIRASFGHETSEADRDVFLKAFKVINDRRRGRLKSEAAA